MKEYANPNIYQERLWDPIWGDIWDFNSGTLAHPNCRCQLALIKVEVDTKTLFAELKQVLLKLKQRLLERKGK